MVSIYKLIPLFIVLSIINLIIIDANAGKTPDTGIYLNQSMNYLDFQGNNYDLSEHEINTATINDLDQKPSIVNPISIGKALINLGGLMTITPLKLTWQTLTSANSKNHPYIESTILLIAGLIQTLINISLYVTLYQFFVNRKTD